MLRNADGSLLDEFNAWDPRWKLAWDAQGHEHLRVEPSAVGRFILPFSPDLTTIDVSDVQLQQQCINIALADLAVLSFDVLGVPVPPEVIVGEPVPVTLRTIVTNNGPATPMDAVLTTSGKPPAGVTVTPGSLDTNALALNLAEHRTLNQTFTIQCNEPGGHTIPFTTAVRPLDPANADLDLSNNQATISFTVDCVVPVQINVEPRSTLNPINTRSQGDIPLAVLTTVAGEYGLPLDFDAQSIDPSSVRFGTYDAVWPELGGAAETHNEGHPEDSLEMDEKTRDRDLDLVLHFGTPASGIPAGATKACVKGEWLDANGDTFKFFGCDTVSAK